MPAGAPVVRTPAGYHQLGDATLVSWSRHAASSWHVAHLLGGVESNCSAGHFKQHHNAYKYLLHRVDGPGADRAAATFSGLPPLPGCCDAASTVGVYAAHLGTSSGPIHQPGMRLVMGLLQQHSTTPTQNWALAWKPHSQYTITTTNASIV